MNNDTISRQAAIDALKDVSEHYTDKGREWHPHVDFMVEAIQELPSAQPERKAGEWIKDKERSKGHIEPIFSCSICNEMEAWGWDEVKVYRYCPNCGARMRGEEV